MLQTELDNWAKRVTPKQGVPMPKERPRLAVSEKTAFHRRLLLEKLPVSAPCDELRLKPTAFYRWHKEFFENGVAAFDREVGMPACGCWTLRIVTSKRSSPGYFPSAAVRAMRAGMPRRSGPGRKSMDLISASGRGLFHWME